MFDRGIFIRSVQHNAENQFKSGMCHLYRFSLIAFFFVFSNSILADDAIRGEAQFNYGQTKNDDNEKSTYYGATGVYYLRPLQRTDGPWYEADFLERAPAVGAAYRKFDFSGLEGYSDYDASSYAVVFRFAEKDQPFFLHVNYGHSDADGFYAPYALNVNSQVDLYSLSVGYFAARNIALGVGYGKSDIDINFQGSPTVTAKADIYNVYGKWLNLLEGNNAVNLEFNINLSKGEDFDGEKQDDNEYELSGDYYFSNQTSAGLIIKANRGDSKGDEGETFGVNFRHFFTQRFSVDAAYEQFGAKNTEGVDDDSFEVNISYWY